MNKNLYSLGLMSGTSMDGIDISIIKSDGEQFIEIIDDMYLKYEDQLKLKLIKTIGLCSSKDYFFTLSEKISELEKEITLCHSQAYKLIAKKNKSIKVDLIGFHGQTVLHKPQEGYSIQIGDSQLLSKLTNTTVISNFRENDILNGGEGAPLSPIYHQLILNKIRSKLPSAIINIGGISNVTYVDEYNEIVSFDMGPGNCLIDLWIRNKTSKEFDKDGLIAKSGQIDEHILNKFLTHPYYKKKFPKSLDVNDFNLQDLYSLSLEDGCATLSMLTVKSICMALHSFKNLPNLILLSGGGRKNKYIFDNIKKEFGNSIMLIDDFNLKKDFSAGLNGDFIESQAFAYLAIRSYLKKFITFPTTTGVKKPCLGGLVYKS